MWKGIYNVTLTKEQTQYLTKYVQRGKHSSRVMTRARILLLADKKEKVSEIALLLQTSKSTVYNTRCRFCKTGLEATLNDKFSPGAPSKLDGKAEAVLTAIACSTPPDGRARWSLQLMADKMVELKIVDSISDDTVHRHLKKTK